MVVAAVADAVAAAVVEFVKSAAGVAVDVATAADDALEALQSPPAPPQFPDEYAQ